jgi:excisionase family DNA binding protein
MNPHGAELDEEVERLLDVHEVANRLGVSPTTVWRWTKDESMPAPVMIGKFTRWRVRDFNAWVAAFPVADPAQRLKRKG